MNILIAPDSFKECLTAQKVARSISHGIKKINPDHNIEVIPISDGGEGSIEFLKMNSHGKVIKHRTENALGDKILSEYFKFNDSKTAWIELSQASGLSLIEKKKRNPGLTSTYGTGVSIQHAIKSGCSEIILSLGGSATNDAGAGIFQALGGKLLDEKNKQIERGCESLSKIKQIKIPKYLNNIKFKIAYDVSNPLLGINGATKTYSIQKGATSNQIEKLEKNIFHFSQIVKKDLKIDITKVKGGGSAGGTAAGLYGLLGAKLTNGFKLIAGFVNLEQKVELSDIIFTAEGRLDYQSLNGKVPIELGKLAKKHKKILICLAGSIEPPYENFYKNGITAIFNIQNKPISLGESIKEAEYQISDISGRVFSFFEKIK
jgi:glycerate kinase